MAGVARSQTHSTSGPPFPGATAPPAPPACFSFPKETLQSSLLGKLLRIL